MCSLIKKAVPTLSLVYTSLAMFPFRFSEGVISTTGGDQGVFSRIQTTEQAMRDACTNHFAAKLLAFFFFVNLSIRIKNTKYLFISKDIITILNTILAGKVEGKEREADIYVDGKIVYEDGQDAT